MVILSNACKPENFESHNSLKLNFMNIRGLHSNFVDYESFLESNSPDILVVCETNMDDSIDSGNLFLCERLSSFNLKGFCYTYGWITQKLYRVPSAMVNFQINFTSINWLTKYSKRLELHDQQAAPKNFQQKYVRNDFYAHAQYWTNNNHLSFFLSY